MIEQFYYTRTEKVQLEDGEKTKDYKDSISLEKVIRSVELADGKRLVLLDDIHDRSTDIPEINPKTNKVVGMKRQRDTYQTEISLSIYDSERFIKITSAD